MLPEIKASSSEVYGDATGDLAGIPVAGDLGDQQAALFGQTCFAVGEAKNTYGTGCFLLLEHGHGGGGSPRSGLITTVGYKIGDQPAVYVLEGSIAITGALVQWLRDNLGMIDKSADIEQLAADGGGQRRRVLRAGVLRAVRALLALRRPRRDRRPDPLREPRATSPARCWRRPPGRSREVADAMNADSGSS